MTALDKKANLAIPTDAFKTDDFLGDSADVVLGPIHTAPRFELGSWAIDDYLADHLFEVVTSALHAFMSRHRDDEGDWIGEDRPSPLDRALDSGGSGGRGKMLGLGAGSSDGGNLGDQGNGLAGFGHGVFARLLGGDDFSAVSPPSADGSSAGLSSSGFDLMLGSFPENGEPAEGVEDGGDVGVNEDAPAMGTLVLERGAVLSDVSAAGGSVFSAAGAAGGVPELSFATTAAFFPIVLENAPTGTFVVIAGGVSRRAVAYSLSNDADGRFDIDAQTGLVTVEDGTRIDYETATEHDIEVTTTYLDGATPAEVETLTVFVRDVNEAPSGIDLDNATVAENADGAAIGVLTTEDQDVGDTHDYVVSDLRFEVVGGQLKLKDGVSLDHEAEPGVVLTVTATDEGGLSTERSFTVTVTDVNEAPGAVDDEAVTTENAAIDVDVLANDTDVDAGDDPATFSLDSVSIASVTGLVGGGTGSVSIEGNQLRFDPGTDFDELDAGDTATVVVDYTMSDDEGVGSAAQATITVTGVNDAPVVQDVSASAVEDGPQVTGLFLGDDVDADDDGVALTYSIVSLPTEGVVVDIDDNVFTFDPGDDFQDLADGETRDVTFGYTARDSNGGVSNIGTVTVTVTGVNDAPTLDVNAGTTVDEGAAKLLSVVELSASDPDNTVAEIVYTVTTGPQHGQLELTTNLGQAIAGFTQEDLAAGRVVYVHDGSELASDSFIFDVSDPVAAGPESQLFSISVNPVNDAPTLDVNTLTIQEGQTKLVGPQTLAASDPDTGPESLTFTIGDLSGGRFERVTDPGTAISTFTQADINGALIRFVHDGGEQPPAYTVTLGDGVETVGPVQADVSFTGSNDAPVVEDVAAAAVEDGAAVTDAFVGDDVDDDDDGTTLTYTITALPSEGGAINNGDGTFTFDPGADFQDLAVGETRDVTFEYTATDGNGAVSNTGRA